LDRDREANLDMCRLLVCIRHVCVLSSTAEENKVIAVAVRSGSDAQLLMPKQLKSMVSAHALCDFAKNMALSA